MSSYRVDNYHSVAIDIPDSMLVLRCPQIYGVRQKAKIFDLSDHRACSDEQLIEQYHAEPYSIYLSDSMILSYYDTTGLLSSGNIHKYQGNLH